MVATCDAQERDLFPYGSGRGGGAMDIQGIQKLTLLDYPGKVACTVFWAGAICAVPSATTGSWWPLPLRL